MGGRKARSSLTKQAALANAKNSDDDSDLNEDATEENHNDDKRWRELTETPKSSNKIQCTHSQNEMTDIITTTVTPGKEDTGNELFNSLKDTSVNHSIEKAKSKLQYLYWKEP